MLSKNHPHRGPLWRSVAYFTISGAVLLFAGANLVSISILFKLVGAVCILFAGLAFKSLFFSKPHDYEYLGVFSLKNQKLIRSIGLSLPWLAIAVGLFTYYAASTSAENHLAKASNSGIHLKKTFNPSVMTAFARKVTRHLAGVDSDTYLTYTKMLMKDELSPSLIRKLTKHRLLPSTSTELNAVAHHMKLERNTCKMKIKSSNIVGMTKKNFLIIDVEFTRIESKGNVTTLTPGKFRYHVGVWSKNKKPVVADLIELPSKYSSVSFKKPSKNLRISS